LLSIKTTGKKRTIAWDSLEIVFELAKPPLLSGRRFEETVLTMTYSWTISNPLFAAAERNLVGKGMIKENIEALTKLEELVTGRTVDSTKRARLSAVDQWYLPSTYRIKT
jgi:hypothetical protein